MKLELENFRSHASSAYQFPETGFVKLGGLSGVGKSNLFKGLQWALFGGKGDVVRWGADKCKVSLELNGMRVARGKNPATFTADDLTGEAGQGHICSTLGMNELEFEVSSYIAQDQVNSFVHCRAAEQLDLLQRLAFHNDNPDLLKERIRQFLSATEEELVPTLKMLAVAEASQQMKSQQLKDLADLVLKKPEKPEVATSELKSRVAELTREGIAVKAKIFAAEKDLKDPLRERAMRAQGALDSLLARKAEFDAWFDTHPDSKFAHEFDMQETRKLVQHLEAQVREYDAMLARIADRNGCERKLKTYREQFISKLQEAATGGLETVSITTVGEIHAAAGKVLAAHKDFQASDTRGAYLEDPAASLQEAKGKLAELEEKHREWVGTQALRDQKRSEALALNIQLATAEKLLASAQELEDADVVRSRLDELRRQQADFEQAIASLSSDLSAAESISGQWAAHRRNMALLERSEHELDVIVENVRTLSARVKQLTERIGKLKRFLELIQKAALVALETRIEEINLRAEHWLEFLFDGNLQASIETEREAKNGNVSHKINLSIFKNGTKVPKKEELSGGEQSRLALAFQLALSDLYRSPVLLLDESLKGCDPSTQAQCLAAIKQIAERKLVLMVEHHIADSQFDHVVQIE